MRKALVILLPAVVLAGGIFLLRDAALDRIAAMAVRAAAAGAAAEGLALEDIRYGDAAFVGLLSPSWSNLSVTVDPSGRGGLPEGERLVLTSKKVVVSPANLGRRTFRLSVEGFDARLYGMAEGAGDETLRLEEVTSETMVVYFEADLFRPWRLGRQLEDAADRLKNVFRTGETSMHLELEGKAAFVFHGEKLDVGFGVRRVGRLWRLTAHQDDLVRMSTKFDLRHPLTAAEVELISRYPMRAAHLFSQRTRARTKAREASRKNPRISEDAYRHVLWSFLLTKKYGTEFARMVTDAHEEGKTGNSEAERRMDVQNNAVGRKYARAGIPPAMLPQIFLADPEVLRFPGPAPSPR